MSKKEYEELIIRKAKEYNIADVEEFRRYLNGRSLEDEFYVKAYIEKIQLDGHI